MQVQRVIPRTTDWKSILRLVRIIHLAMFAAALFQLYVLYSLSSQRTAPKPLDPILNYVLTAVGLVDFIIAVVTRTVLFKRAEPLLQANAMDPRGQLQWRAANIVSSAFSYSIFLFGWVLAFMGGLQWYTEVLWAVSAIAFFLFIPQSPIDETTQANLPPPMQN